MDEYGDEDGRTILLGDNGASKQSPEKKFDIGLDIEYANRFSSENEETNFPVQEEEIMVVFDLPDGSQGEHSFKLGHTVEYVKSFVESEYGIRMSEQKLFLESNTLMIDPMSLLDYEEVKGVEEIFVRVDGPLTTAYRK